MRRNYSDPCAYPKALFEAFFEGNFDAIDNEFDNLNFDSEEEENWFIAQKIRENFNILNNNASDDDGEAHYWLGVVMYSDDSPVYNPEQSFREAQIAVNLGYYKAYRLLGTHYLEGLNDKETAISLFKQGLNAGDRLCGEMLNDLEKKSRRSERLGKAAKFGAAFALNFLSGYDDGDKY